MPLKCSVQSRSELALCLAQYCHALAEEAGSVNVLHVVSRLNDEFGFCPMHQVMQTADDVLRFFRCIENHGSEALADTDHRHAPKEASLVGARRALAEKLGCFAKSQALQRAR